MCQHNYYVSAPAGSWLFFLWFKLHSLLCSLSSTATASHAIPWWGRCLKHWPHLPWIYLWHCAGEELKALAIYDLQLRVTFPLLQRPRQFLTGIDVPVCWHQFVGLLTKQPKLTSLWKCSWFQIALAWNKSGSLEVQGQRECWKGSCIQEMTRMFHPGVNCILCNSSSLELLMKCCRRVVSKTSEQKQQKDNKALLTSSNESSSLYLVTELYKPL